MSATVHFGQHLTRPNIEAVAKRHGFANRINIEKFLIDFEVLYHMRQAMPECVVMGGMAVPFHLGRGATARLSVDVDVVTGLDAKGSRQAMEHAFADMDGTIKDIKPHKPRSPKKNLPLHTYFCSYNSVLDSKLREIKIDLFYGGRPAAQTAHFQPPTALPGLEVDFVVTTYDYSQTIADKLSTLAFGTIGLDSTDPGVPKHIHDIASLIMSDGGRIDVSRIAAALGMTCREEAGYMQGVRPTDEEICGSLRAFYRSILVGSTGLELDGPYAGRFGHFATNMLARSQSKKRLHVTDIMLAGSLAEIVADVRASKLAADDATETIGQIREMLGKITAMPVADSNKIAKDLRRAYSKDSRDYNLVKTMQADQAYLYGFLSQPAQR